MAYQGNYTLRAGGSPGSERAPRAVIPRAMPEFDLYYCPVCDRVELFRPHRRGGDGTEVHYAALRTAEDADVLFTLHAADASVERREAAAWVCEERGLDPIAALKKTPEEGPAGCPRQKPRREDPWD